MQDDKIKQIDSIMKQNFELMVNGQRILKEIADKLYLDILENKYAMNTLYEKITSAVMDGMRQVAYARIVSQIDEAGIKREEFEDFQKQRLATKEYSSKPIEEIKKEIEAKLNTALPVGMIAKVIGIHGNDDKEGT